MGPKRVPKPRFDIKVFLAKATAEERLSNAAQARTFLSKATRQTPFSTSEHGEALRANIAETLLVSSITEQGGKEIQHEEHEDILSGPVRRAQ
jgi:hypothetical protein